MRRKRDPTTRIGCGPRPDSPSLGRDPGEPAVVDTIIAGAAEIGHARRLWEPTFCCVACAPSTHVSRGPAAQHSKSRRRCWLIRACPRCSTRVVQTSRACRRGRPDDRRLWRHFEDRRAGRCRSGDRRAARVEVWKRATSRRLRRRAKHRRLSAAAGQDLPAKMAPRRASDLLLDREYLT